MMNQETDKDVTQWAARNKSFVTIERLPGDASSRVYFRIFLKSKKTMILMRTDPFPTEKENLPFLVMQKHLLKANVDVPEVIEFDPSKGFVMLEDLGDVTLLKKLQTVCSDDVERHLYEQVIDELVLMHVNASPGPNKARFDQEKLMWEVGFTVEHFYQTHLGRNISEADLAVINTSFGEICQLLADEPVVYTHRDFHSRNVMVLKDSKKEDRFVMIDFQDARLGPIQYDLASLLKDSYYQLEEVQVSRLLDYYMVKWEATTGSKLDREHFRYIFDLMSVQRNFKAIGSFASFLNRRNNATYLKYIGNTFENIRKTLLKYPQYSKLREILFHYYYF